MKTTKEENALEVVEQNENFVAIRTGSDDALTFAEKLVIKDDSSIEAYNSGLANVKEAIDRAEKTRRFFTDPLNEQVKKINDMFRPFGVKLKQAEGILKQKFLAYHDEQERIAAAERAKIEKQLAAKKITIEKAAEKVGKIDEPAKSTVSAFTGAKSTVRIRMVLEIEDETKLPRVYLFPDLRKIEDSLKKGIAVPGAKLVEHKEVASGRTLAF